METGIVAANLYGSASADATNAFSRYTVELSNQRAVALLQDVSQYQVAVVKVTMGGFRELPVTIPAVVLGQLDPNKLVAACTVTLKSRVYPTTTWPVSVNSYISFNIRTFLPSGVLMNSFLVGLANTGTQFATVDAWATNIMTSINIQLLNSSTNPDIDPVVAKLQVEAVQGCLVWSIASGSYPAGSYIEVDTNTVSPLATNVRPDALGFAAIAPVLVNGSVPQGIYTLTIPSNGTTVASPNRPFYANPVTAIGMSSQNLQWIPQNTETQRPPPPFVSQDVESSRYYWCQDFEWWCGILNTALATAFNAAAASVIQTITTAGTPVSSASISPPWISYNASSNSFSVYVDPAISIQGLPSIQVTPYTSLVGQATSNPISYFMSIDFNEILANLMLLPQTRYESGGSTLTFISAYQTVTTANPVGIVKTWNVYMGSMNATANGWSPWSDVVLTSSTIPIQSEAVPPTTVFGGSNTSGGFTTTLGSGLTQMLQDFTPANTAAGWVEELTGLQSYVYKWSDMVGAGPLTQLQLRVCLRYAQSGALYPLEFDPMSWVNVKMIFRPKQLTYA